MKIEDRAKSFGHTFPSSHPEVDFARHVEHLAKQTDSYPEQTSHLKHLLADRSWRVTRILDVGAGEGAFTKTVLDLLANAAPNAPIPRVDVIEKDASLWTKCETRLHGAGAKCTRIAVNFFDDSPYKMPRRREELLASCEKIYNNHGQYDLIVVSHSTYYFDNAGVDLAYSLLSRLLKPNGVAWFIVRDRECAFYKNRAELLARRELPDFNREYFSDAFLDRLRCLVTDTSVGPKKLISQSRRFGIVSADNDLIEYLYWLRGMTASELLGASESVRDGGFAESHIWITPIEANDCRVQEECDHLAAVEVIGRCIDALRRIAPDIQTHRVSLARIEPTGMVKRTNLREADIDLPGVYYNAFRLYSVGYACEILHEAQSDLLKRFFQDHTSFLFYSRFYHDYKGSPSGPDYSYCKNLGKVAKIGKIVDYPLRECERAHQEFCPQDGNQLPLANAIDTWDNMLGLYYGEVASNPDQSTLWSICIGCNVLQNFRAALESRDSLNTCSAIFLTVSTATNLKSHAQDFVGHIKVSLAQWIAGHLHDKITSQMESMRKYQEMLTFLGEPLNNLSNALTTIQHDAQTLRTVLYDPGKVIFESHSKLTPLYVDGHDIHATRNILAKVAHLPERYNSEPGRLKDGQCVLAVALMTLFGKEEELRKSEAHTVEELLSLITRVIKELGEDGAFEELTEDVFWLCSRGECILARLSENKVSRKVLIESTLKSWLLNPRQPLDQLKHAVHYPFKIDAAAWSGWALLLAVKRYLKNVNDCEIAGKTGIFGAMEDIDVLPQSTPATYSMILQFLMGLAVAQREKVSDAYSIRRICFSRNQSGMRIKVDLNGPPIHSAVVTNLKRQALAVLRIPRDWRIRDAAQGNFMGPFIDFASSLLGINSDPENRIDHLWNIESVSESKVSQIFCLSKGSGSGKVVKKFCLNIETIESEGSSVEIEWS